MFLQKLQFQRSLLRWYDRARRDLPWRVALGIQPNPYHILISETMLQQTQVKMVLPYFHKFIQTWPTLNDLAAADEQAVLKAWQGLGYYSRARNLLACVRKIAQEHAGRIPRDVPSLLKLPGIGRYTAGAVASIAFDTSAPIVDGNVARVLSRLDKIESDPRDRGTLQYLWHRAEEILPQKRVGDFNSALMELGSTVCTPRTPKCLVCPVRQHCEAVAAGLQEMIPPPKKSKPIPLVQRRTFCLRHGTNGDTKFLIEQRPSRGRWAGMWQFLTVETDKRTICPKTVHSICGLKSSSPRSMGTIEHALTHRRYQFDVYLCDVREHRSSDKKSELDESRRWVRLSELEQYPLPRPHARIAEMLLQLESNSLNPVNSSEGT